MNNEQERADFEVWYQQHHGRRDMYERDASGEYADKQVQGAFNVWQARAAQPSGQAQQKAPSDESMMQALNLGTFTDRPLKDDEQVLVSWGTLKKALSRYGPQPAVNFGLQEALSDDDLVQMMVDRGWKHLDEEEKTDIVSFARTLLARYATPVTAKPQPFGNVGALDDVLADALSNLEHDNYERSYSGSQNREADAALIRAALAAQRQSSGDAGDALLAAFDAAVATVLPRISTLKYNSQEICKHFAGEVRAALAAMEKQK